MKQTLDDLLYFETFNPVFFAVFAFFLVISLVIIRILRDKDDKTKRNFLFVVYSVLFVFFILYKALLPLDKEYMEVYKETYGYFSYLNELPFNPCNVALILILVSLHTKNRKIHATCFFISTFGPLFALLMPSAGCSACSLLSIHMIGFYGTHFAAFMIPVVMYGTKLYSPEYKDSVTFLLTFLILTFIAFLIDLLLVKTGLCDIANYFFCMGDYGNPVLKMLFNVIPVPFVYLLPFSIVVIPACCLITSVYKGFGRLFKKI